MALPAHHGTGTRTEDGMVYRRTHPQAPGCAAEVRHVTNGGVSFRVVTTENPDPEWRPAANVPAAIQIAARCLAATPRWRTRRAHQAASARPAGNLQ